MATKDILRPRLRGGRFENGAIPTDFLDDLSGLGKLILEVAKWRYLQDNPKGQFPPREDIDIQLSSVEQGSAIPVFRIFTPQETLMGELPYEQYFFGAVESIVESVIAAVQGRLPSSNGYIKQEHFARFNRIGRNLRSDESIELQSVSSKLSAKIDQQTRKKLVEISLAETLYKEVAIRGAVSEFDQDRMTFQVQPIHGRKVSGPVPEQGYDTFMDVFKDYRDGALALVEGGGKYNRQDRPLAMESVSRISKLHPLDVPARLDEFRNMQDGWHEGDGKAPPHSGLDWLSDAFRRGYPADLPLPYTSPLFDSGVQCDWTIGQFCLEIEIDLDAHKGDWLWFDMKSDFFNEFEEKILNLDDPGAWVWMANRIRETSEQAE